MSRRTSCERGSHAWTTTVLSAKPASLSIRKSILQPAVPREKIHDEFSVRRSDGGLPTLPAWPQATLHRMEPPRKARRAAAAHYPPDGLGDSLRWLASCGPGGRPGTVGSARPRKPGSHDAGFQDSKLMPYPTTRLRPS